MKNCDSVSVEIVNDEGYSEINKDNYFPAIIKWKCPVCGQKNEMNLMYQPISVMFEKPSVVHLICDSVGCVYEKDILLKVNLNFEVLKDNFKSDEEFEKASREYYENNKYKGFCKQEMKRGTFLKIFTN